MTRATTPTSSCKLRYGTTTISYGLRFSKRKTLGISVLPDLKVLVTAPQGAALNDVESKVRKRAAWILKQQNYFRDFLPIPKAPRYVSGETHRFLGKQFRLKIVRGFSEKVRLSGGFIEVTLLDTQNPDHVKKLVNRWLRARAEHHYEQSFLRSLEGFGKRLTCTPGYTIRRMKNRWGSVGENRVIYLHPDLVRTSRACIDYVVTHELCHLLIPDHGPNFFALLGQVMPDWERWKQRLELSTKA
jgi:predicted metal-dependent hydrolase